MKEEARKIVEHYGIEVQARQTMEECAELIQALNKHLRSGDYKTVLAIAEEIADVQIMLEQMKIHFNIEKETAQLMEEKINRTLERMEKDTMKQAERLTEKIDDEDTIQYIVRQDRVNGKIIDNQMCLNKLGEYEDYEVIGNIHDNPELLKG